MLCVVITSVILLLRDSLSLLSLLSYFPAHIISAAVAGRQSGREPARVKLSAAVASIAAQEENSLTSIDWDKILTG